MDKIYRREIAETFAKIELNGRDSSAPLSARAYIWVISAIIFLLILLVARQLEGLC